MMTKIIVW